MQILGGVHAGQALAGPVTIGAPHGDSFRAALFAHALLADLAGRRVLDLFAGNGALGLEALSRGASFALFVETEPSLRGAIRDNIEATGLFGATRIHRRDAGDLGDKPAGLGAPFDLVFLPNAPAAILTRLREGGWISAGALIVAPNASAIDAAGFTTLASALVEGALTVFLIVA